MQSEIRNSYASEFLGYKYVYHGANVSVAKFTNNYATQHKYFFGSKYCLGNHAVLDYFECTSSVLHKRKSFLTSCR